jgi:hypothetical protein
MHGAEQGHPPVVGGALVQRESDVQGDEAVAREVFAGEVVDGAAEDDGTEQAAEPGACSGRIGWRGGQAEARGSAGHFQHFIA